MKTEQKQKQGEWIEQPIYTVNGQRMLKRYKKLKLVGEGSYSKCWLVKTENSQSTYVAKIIPKKKLQMLVKQKLVYQIRIHQQLSHPNVVHLDHWFQDESYQYIFMEYCSQGNLQKQMESRNSMSEKDIKRYVRQIVEAIRYIHSKNILHRDLKLCNFYLDGDKNIKLGDFGFACQLAHQGELKRQTCGTPNYIAPEAVSGFGYSFSSDVWAVGVILFRLKYRECPFQAKTVRQTLERVKLCQYSFPKGKISPEMKDLIQKIFVINYDDRLTLDQILAHPFLEQNQPVQTRAKSQAKGSFTMIRNMFSREKVKKQSTNSRSSRLKEQQNNLAKRSNSCETFKQIKQILKSKSKPTLLNQTTELKTQQNASSINYTQSNSTVRDKTLLGGTNTMRSIADTSFGMGVINKRLQGTARMNNILGNVKEQLKIQSRVPVASKQGISGGQQLAMITKKYYIPSELLFEKDVVIVNYKDSVKQLIYHGQGFVLHRGKAQLFEMNAKIYKNAPKLLRYIVDNRLQITEAEPQEEEFGQISLQKILMFISHKWIAVKDGVILFFGTSGLFIAKMVNQQLFYIGSAVKQGDYLKQDNKISLMYTKQGNTIKCAEGVVLSRIYQGWVGSTLKNNITHDK